MPKNVYVIGVFDLFHKGHIRILKAAREMGDRLLVAINSDMLVEQYKGDKPIFSESDRLEILNACRYVDKAFIIHQFDNKDILLNEAVDVIVHGDDWDHDSYLKQIGVDEDFLNKHQITMAYLPYTSGISTSAVKAQIRGIEA